MSEGVFNVIAFGRQSVVGTAVAATTLFPGDPGFLGFELDRAVESPEEDIGSTSREYSGRGSYGVRWATASMPFVARFEDLMHAFEMHVDTIGTPTGTASPYSWVYTFDETGGLLNTALKPYTIEYGVDGSTQDEWEALGVIATDLELGFDALSAPGNQMWRGSLGLVALNRYPASLTGTAVAPSSLETLEGHLTTFSEGSTSTAFGSLTQADATLKQFSFRSSLNAAGRAYGGSDTSQAIGRSGKGEVSFDALVAISSTTDTDILDVFEEAAGLVTERRWRLAVDGAGVNALTIDFRCRFTAVNVGEHEKERLYAVNGVWVYDSTLGGRGQFTLTNAVSAIP
jgi:hypothetical protein